MINITLVPLIYFTISGFSENVLYDSGPAQDQKCDEQNYACIDDPPAKPQPTKKKGKKPARPLPYDSGPKQKQKFDEQNYACIDDPPEKPPPRTKQDKKPACPQNNVYSQPVKKSQRDAPKSAQEAPNSGKNATMNLNNDDTVMNPIYNCGNAWDTHLYVYSRILTIK